MTHCIAAALNCIWKEKKTMSHQINALNSFHDCSISICYLCDGLRMVKYILWCNVFFCCKFVCAALVTMSRGPRIALKRPVYLIFFSLRIELICLTMVTVAWHSMDFMANYFVSGLFATGWENLLWFCVSDAINRVFALAKMSDYKHGFYFVFRSRLFFCFFVCVLFSFHFIFAVMSIQQQNHLLPS